MLGNPSRDDPQQIIIESPLRERINTAGPKDAMSLGNRCLRLLQVHDAKGADDVVEGAATVGQAFGIAFVEWDGRIVPGRSGDHRRCEVDPLSGCAALHCSGG